MGKENFIRRIVDHHSNYMFPQNLLLPLKITKFDNEKVFIPNDPETFLKWEYGKCLGKNKFYNF